MAPSITRHDLLIGIYDGTVTVVDARPAAVFAHRRICSSINLPVEEADYRAAELLPDRNEPIVTYCEAGAPRAEALAARLFALGYTDVRVYREGFEDWLAADLPAERPSRDDIAA
jgi:rhodanese-related sulfurtransferase